MASFSRPHEVNGKPEPGKKRRGIYFDPNSGDQWIVGDRGSVRWFSNVWNRPHPDKRDDDETFVPPVEAAPEPEPEIEDGSKYNAAYIKSRMLDGETFDQTRSRLLARFNELLNLVRQGGTDDQIKEYQDMTENFFRS